ncbi:putative uncharacterized protein DDB_G0271606 [Nilaparvata lugens]|uniref:putative uncharacterized protein DDB_G0271606 n=1 Tax=Nilaparvata lugens TaxID=108931 RepID=UPI00193D9F8D|nr:putative uncharacterized protein DDB_G0271606 [Nilaparvata lugens]
MASTSNARPNPPKRRREEDGNVAPPKRRCIAPQQAPLRRSQRIIQKNAERLEQEQQQQQQQLQQLQQQWLQQQWLQQQQQLYPPTYQQHQQWIQQQQQQQLELQRLEQQQALNFRQRPRTTDMDVFLIMDANRDEIVTRAEYARFLDLAATQQRSIFNYRYIRTRLNMAFNGGKQYITSDDIVGLKVDLRSHQPANQPGYSRRDIEELFGVSHEKSMEFFYYQNNRKKDFITALELVYKLRHSDIKFE